MQCQALALVSASSAAYPPITVPPPIIDHLRGVPLVVLNSSEDCG